MTQILFLPLYSQGHNKDFQHSIDNKLKSIASSTEAFSYQCMGSKNTENFSYCQCCPVFEYSYWT